MLASMLEHPQNRKKRNATIDRRFESKTKHIRYKGENLDGNYIKSTTQAPLRRSLRNMKGSHKLMIRYKVPPHSPQRRSGWRQSSRKRNSFGKSFVDLEKSSKDGTSTTKNHIEICNVCKGRGDLTKCYATVSDRVIGCGKSVHIYCVGRVDTANGDWICDCCAKKHGYDVESSFPDHGYTFPPNETNQLNDKVRSEEKSSNEVCSFCSTGGTLMTCQTKKGSVNIGCGKHAHASCVGRDCIPNGDWICSYCAEVLVLPVHNSNREYGYEFVTNRDCADWCSTKSLHVETAASDELDKGDTQCCERIRGKDVLCGRYLPTSMRRDGYLEFQKCLSANQEAYQHVHRQDRRAFCQVVMKTLKERGIRFVKQNRDSRTKCKPLTYEKGVEKIMQTFRDLRGKAVRGIENDDFKKPLPKPFNEDALPLFIENPNDIICGKGSRELHSCQGFQQHGYLTFHYFIDTMLDGYDKASRYTEKDDAPIYLTKRGISEKVYNLLKQENIRFVQWDTKTASLVPLDEDDALAKITRTFRDKQVQNASSDYFSASPSPPPLDMNAPIQHVLLLNKGNTSSKKARKEETPIK